MIKVSIVVPIYNMEDRLDKCLVSLEKQTLSDIEIIVINDGSTDNSLEIIQKHAKRHPSLYKIISRENKGISASRNDGIDASSGECISFVDSDDYVELDMYEKMYNKLIEKELDIVVCGMKFVDDMDNILGYCDLSKVNITTLYNNPKLVHQIDFGPCNKLFKKNLFENLRFPLKVKYEDLNTILKAFYRANSIGYVNGFYYNYYRNNNGETLSINGKVYDIFKILDDIKSYFCEANSCLKKEIDYLCINKLMDYVEIISSNGNKELAIEFYRQTTKYLNNKIKLWELSYLFSNNTSLKKFLLKLIQINKKIYIKRIINKSKSR